MINCRQAAQLSSRALEGSLSLRQRLELKFHLWMCVFCRRYGQQMHWLHRFCEQYADQAHQRDELLPPLPAESRGRILARLKQASE